MTDEPKTTALAIFDSKFLMDGGELVYQTQMNEQVKLSLDICRKLASTKPGVELTTTEALMFLKTCRTYQLDPILRQIYCIKYDASKVASLVIARDTYVRIADRHPSYQGYETGWIITDKTGKMRKCIPAGSECAAEEAIIGAWCKVFRNNRHTPTVEVLTQEIYKGQSTRNGMPQIMTLKCAVVQAHRAVFPDLLGGLYSEDELPAIDGTVVPQPDESARVLPREERTGDDSDVMTVDTALTATLNQFYDLMEAHGQKVDRDNPNDRDSLIFRHCASYYLSGTKEEYLEMEAWTIDKAIALREALHEYGLPSEIVRIYLSEPETTKKTKKEPEPKPAPEGDLPF